MNQEEVRDYCLKKSDVAEGFPFGETVLVFKANNKIFALMSLDEIPFTINLKCDPEAAIDLRVKFPSIIPGYHMNKKHWNTLIMDGSIPHKVIKELIDRSYNLVCSKTSKKKVSKR